MYEFKSICGLLTIIFPGQRFLAHTSPHKQWGTVDRKRLASKDG